MRERRVTLLFCLFFLLSFVSCGRVRDGLIEIPAKATSCATTADCPLISLGFTPAGIAIDVSGNIWVTNDTSSGSVTEIPSSASVSCSTCLTFSGFSDPVAVAMNTTLTTPWIANSGSGGTSPPGIVEITETSFCVSGFSGGCPVITHFTQPIGLAFDSGGNL